MEGPFYRMLFLIFDRTKQTLKIFNYSLLIQLRLDM